MITGNGLLQIGILFGVLLLLLKPLGHHIASIYQNKSTTLDRLCLPIERLVYRLCCINANDKMNWITYLFSMLFLNFISILFVYAVQRFQLSLPLNPQHFTGVDPDLAFNTAVSYATNTNWQAYSGEASISYFTQMCALAVQNFISAASGIAILIALIRGLARQESTDLGNYWVDVIRGILYLLLPLAMILAVLLIATGVIQNFKPYQTSSLLQPVHYQYTPSNLPVGKIKQPTDATSTEQLIPMGPVASQIAIKQLGSNGGGFFGTNSAHPYENPNPMSNFLELLAILLIPTALCYTFGIMVNDTRQGLALLLAMFILFTPFLYTAVTSEQLGNPAFNALGIDQHANNLSPGGNMEGKETRFGIVSSAIWATATTATANGSVNSMHDSYMPMGGLVTLWMMHLGEIVFGGVGSGLYGMFMLVIIAVFVAGLMVGRTPEYLGKKIEPFEMKMASLAVLVMPLIVLVFTAISVTTQAGVAATANPGIHGFNEILYAFTSMTNNNGSAFAGLNANQPLYNILGGIAMLIGRYWFAIFVLAIAGSLVKKKMTPASSGTLPTDTLLFVILLACVSMILGALSFLPSLALGPIAEQLMLWRQYGS